MGLTGSAASWHYQCLLLVPYNSAVSVLADDLFDLPLLWPMFSRIRAQHFVPPSVCLSCPAVPVTLTRLLAFSYVSVSSGIEAASLIVKRKFDAISCS